VEVLAEISESLQRGDNTKVADLTRRAIDAVELVKNLLGAA